MPLVFSGEVLAGELTVRNGVYPVTEIDVRQGDTQPPVAVSLWDGDGRVDLTGATVAFSFGVNSGKALGGSATVVDAVNGEVAYLWRSTDTAAPGRYFAKFAATFPSGDTVSFPNERDLVLAVRRDVAATPPPPTSESDLLVTQNAGFSLTVPYVIDGADIDTVPNITGWSAHMQVQIVASKAIQLNLTPGSGLTVNGAAGTVTISLTAAQTAALPLAPMVYDLFLLPPGQDPVFLAGGRVEVTPTVTR